MRKAARLARPLRNAMTTGRVGSVAVAVVASSGMTTAMVPAVATRTAVGMEAVDTEEVSGAVGKPHVLFSSCEGYGILVTSKSHS